MGGGQAAQSRGSGLRRPGPPSNSASPPRFAGAGLSHGCPENVGGCGQGAEAVPGTDTDTHTRDVRSLFKDGLAFAPLSAPHRHDSSPQSRSATVKGLGQSALTRIRGENRDAAPPYTSTQAHTRLRSPPRGAPSASTRLSRLREEAVKKWLNNDGGGVPDGEDRAPSSPWSVPGAECGAQQGHSLHCWHSIRAT